MPADAEEAREFGRAFLSFLSWVHETDGRAAQNEVVQRVRSFLGEDRLRHSVVARELPPFDHVNLQVALNHWMAGAGRHVEVEGVTVPPHFAAPTLQQLIHGEGMPPVRLSAPGLVDLASGPGQTLACLTSALLLVDDPLGRYVMFVRGPDRHQEPMLNIEVAGLPTAQAQDVLRELVELSSTLNVYRGQLLELVPGPTGLSIAFAALPPTAREDVVLSPAVLRRVERHTIDIATRRTELLAAGQHLKRGLLLYGPPGTGKTHTMRYLVQQLSGSTVLMLSGQSLHLIGTVSQLARELQPSVVVLEDVDLVAEDRGFGPGSSPILFDLLDAMDGAAPDADLLFLLTTNRADLLEPARAARPGRVDVAVEIGLPDADARRRLLALYSRGVPLALTDGDVAAVVDRTDGVTASFIKELLRRAVLEAIDDRGTPLHEVTGAHMARALDDLLDSTQSVTRALLGVPGDQRPSSASYGAGGRVRHDGMGWAVPGIHAPGAGYSSRVEITPDSRDDR
ncbi:MAG: AAA family ATPase [Actinomycetes bacterium]